MHEARVRWKTRVWTVAAAVRKPEALLSHSTLIFTPDERPSARKSSCIKAEAKELSLRVCSFQSRCDCVSPRAHTLGVSGMAFQKGTRERVKPTLNLGSCGLGPEKDWM